MFSKSVLWNFILITDFVTWPNVYLEFYINFMLVGLLHGKSK